MNLFKLILGILGFELRREARKAVKRVGEAILPPEEEPFPLTMRDVQHQQDQIRSATSRGSGERPRTILPPTR